MSQWLLEIISPLFLMPKYEVLFIKNLNRILCFKWYHFLGLKTPLLYIVSAKVIWLWIMLLEICIFANLFFIAS